MPATGVEAETSWSSVVPLLMMVRKAPPLGTPATEARAQGATISIDPSDELCAWAIPAKPMNKARA